MMSQIKKLNFSSGQILVVISAISYAILTLLLSKFKMSTDWPESQILFFRFLVAGFLSLLLGKVLVQNLKNTISLKVTIAGVFYCLTSLSFYKAISLIGPTEATAILFSYPLFIFLLKTLEERSISLLLLCTAVFASTGCFFAISPDLSNSELLSPSLFLAPLFYAFYIWLAGELKLNSSIFNSGVIFLTSSFLIFGTHFQSLHFFAAFSLNIEQSLIFFGICILTVSSVLSFLKGTQRIGSYSSSIIASTEPGIILILSFLLLSEDISFLQSMGIVLIIFSNILLAKYKSDST